jgi:hypothetical protein
VPNPNQANRDGDKYGDACDKTGCHPACATGCSKPNDITTCTTPFFGGKARSCRRCAKGYHGEAGKPGCVPGAPRGKCVEAPSPAPTPAPAPVCTLDFTAPGSSPAACAFISTLLPSPATYGGLLWTTSTASTMSSYLIFRQGCVSPPQPTGRSGGRGLGFDVSSPGSGLILPLRLGSSGGAPGRFDLQSLYVSPYAGITWASVVFKAMRNGSPVGTDVVLSNVVGTGNDNSSFRKVDFTADFQDIDGVDVMFTVEPTNSPTCAWCQCQVLWHGGPSHSSPHA